MVFLPTTSHLAYGVLPVTAIIKQAVLFHFHHYGDVTSIHQHQCYYHLCQFNHISVYSSPKEYLPAT